MPGGRSGTFLSRLAAVMAAGFLLLAPTRADDTEVDLALVLAIDCSFSVDSSEFRQQMEGLGQALMRPDVKAAIRAGAHQRIAITAYEWSDADTQAVILPWVILSGDADADEVGRTLAAMPRKLAEGGTSISAALLFGDALFATAPRAPRQVIDVSSDGRNNVGPPVNAVRDRLVAQGVTINAVTIMNEWPTLDTYFERQVVGGEGHFVIPAKDYESYAEAIHKKLLREITGPGIS
ncbi:DUF1194 domain-containing protein [Aestuariivirga sp.]|uniref:DUF1194 domain-containing protein n=1 Tax=Aestuariivirga sp. TaxID=2650926 RepID=UPI0039E27004